jgi:hypothetical protein
VALTSLGLLAVKSFSQSTKVRSQDFWRRTMSTRPPPTPINRKWKALYRDAIFETNRAAIPWRLTAAEEAVLARGQELFRQTGNLEEREEREEVETALYCLRAYKNACARSQAA